MATPTAGAFNKRDATSESAVRAQTEYSSASFRESIQKKGGACAEIYNFPTEIEELGEPKCIEPVEGLLINRRARGFHSYSLNRGDDADLAYVAERLAKDAVATRAFLKLLGDRPTMSKVIESSVFSGRNGRLDPQRSTYSMIYNAVDAHIINAGKGYSVTVGIVFAHLLYCNLRQCGVAVEAEPLRSQHYESQLAPTFEDLRRHYLEDSLEQALSSSGISTVGRSMSRDYLTLQLFTEKFLRSARQVSRYVRGHDCYISDFDMVMTIVFVDLLRPEVLENCEYDTRPASTLGLLSKSFQSYINIVWMAVEAHNNPGTIYPDLSLVDTFYASRMQIAADNVREWASRMFDNSRYASLPLSTIRDATRQTVVQDYLGRTVSTVLSFDVGTSLIADVRFAMKYLGEPAEDHVAQPEGNALFERIFPSDPKLFSYEFMHNAIGDSFHAMRVSGCFAQLTWDEMLPHAMAVAATGNIEIHHSAPREVSTLNPGHFSLGYQLPPGMKPNVFIDGETPYQVAYGDMFRTSNPLLALAAQGELYSKQLPVQTFGHQTLSESNDRTWFDTTQVAGFLTQMNASVAQEIVTQFDEDGSNISKIVVCDIDDIFRCRGLLYNADERPSLVRYMNPLGRHIFMIHFNAFRCLRDWLETERDDQERFAGAALRAAESLNNAFYFGVVKTFPPQEITRITSTLISKHLTDGVFPAFNTRQLDIHIRANVRALIMTTVITQLFRLNETQTLYFLEALMHQDLYQLFRNDADLKIPLQMWVTC